ncbi:DUF6355 family natural product biosynthesis protein [Fodinicola acaciae]|uniref:DUF6355 family natural product biosynthesis protein n=1 Tax=Fodinicola acaciae TaxID=2681555 RepID=UPI0013D5F307|nr:DUF6355 family natural product biosynthesis protein [Fodinicola acaciae]
MRIKSNARRRALALLAATAFAVSATTGVTATAAAAAESKSKPCGFSSSDGWAWYNHCTSDGSLIVIHIDKRFVSDEFLCVGPGLTALGAPEVIRNAWYTGDLCNKRGPIDQ